ncbi:helix-turn-helix transcriptional regulator [Cryptosporangium arvum]|uniref:helix-turn-helix transcriptional regulator n=1 Tax=Cryptosporangium arvum TaxID=80871 RepID=UPI0004BC41A9|nr:LuxR family transcriptional regulator [Cryptosporangium arvum]
MGAPHDPELVGRGTERRVVAELVDRLPGEGGALVVRGEPGLGKSTLLAEAVRLAGAAGARVLRTTGVESAAPVAFGGLEQLLRPLRDRIDALAPPERSAVHSALGRIDAPVPELFLVALATLNLVADAAPAVVIVEDAQWLDSESADVLAFLARRVELESIVLLAAVRDGYPGPFDDVRALELPPLSGADAAVLLDARFPALSPVARRRVLDEAAGNPLALVELPVALTQLPVGPARLRFRPPTSGPPTSGPPAVAPAGPVGSGPVGSGPVGSGPVAAGPAAMDATNWLRLPERLERAFGARTAGLAPDTLNLLLLAALNASDSLAEVLAAGGPGRTVDDLLPAVRVGLIEFGDGRLRFRHPLVRSAVVQRATAGQRHEAHAALARVLDDDIERRAWHRGASVVGPDEDVAAELDAAGERALRRGGVETAVQAYERAARLSATPARRADRLLRAADLATELGRREDVARLLGQAESLELSDAQRTLAAWISDADDDGIHDLVADVRRQADFAERVAAAGNVDLAMKILYRAAIRCFFAEPGDAVRERLAATAESLSPDPADGRLLAILGHVAPIERGRAIHDHLARAADRAAGDPAVARLVGNAAIALGAFDVGLAMQTTAIAGLRAQGRLALLARATSIQAWCALQVMDLGVAITSAQEAVRLSTETAQPTIALLARSRESLIAAMRGDHDECEQIAGEVERRALPAGVRPVLTMVQLARGASALGVGRYSDAFEHLRRVHDPADPAYHHLTRCFSVGDVVEAAVRSGRNDEARALLVDLEQVGSRTPSPALHINLRYARALMAAEEEPFLIALRADLARWPFARARLLLAYGEWLRRQRRPAEARAHLRAAREAFDALGVVAWGDRARSELRASGETSRGRVARASELLTPQELQIAQMAAEGLTNREIGQKLYLSHRTISTHLHRIYPKLGVTSRGALSAALDGTVR